MSDLYDRAGQPITMDQYAALMQANEDPRRVALDTVGDIRLSTVWLGINHAYGSGPPIIFESMTFTDEGDDPHGWDTFCWRYATEAQALAGHDAILAVLRAHGHPDEVTL